MFNGKQNSSSSADRVGFATTGSCVRYMNIKANEVVSKIPKNSFGKCVHFNEVL